MRQRQTARAPDTRLIIVALLVLFPTTRQNVAADILSAAADRPVWLQEAYDWAKNIEAFPSMSLHQRRLQAIDACQMDAMINEQAVAQFQCECQPQGDQVRLVCIPDCAYCNTEQTSCGIRSAQALYNAEGTRTALAGVLQYTTGCFAGDILTVEQNGCTSDGTCTGCAVFANNEQCNSCILRTCPESGELRELIDCENIEAGATFDLCNPVTVETGIFEGFSTGEYEVCLDPALLELAAASPASSGKGSKSSRSSSDDDCPDTSPVATSKGSKSTSPSSSSSSGSKTSKSGSLSTHPPSVAPTPLATVASSAGPTQGQFPVASPVSSIVTPSPTRRPTHDTTRSSKSSSSSSSSSWGSSYKKTKERRVEEHQ